MTPFAHHTRDPRGGDDGLREVLCDVSGRRELVRRLRAAHPGMRFSVRRSFDVAAQPRRGRVGVWLWRGSDEQVRTQATELLLRFVHPLVASGQAFCVAWPFGVDVFARRRLGLRESAALDLEDIGALLGLAEAAQRPCRRPARPRGLQSPPATAAARQARAAGEQLDAAQRAAVRHGRGAARVLAPAGSGKTKTLVGRVAELVARGADPGEILLLAFNRKAAEQLEERLGGLGVATTRSLRDGGPPAVHCATFNAFGYRYQRQVLGARFTLCDSAGQRALVREAMEAAGAGLHALRPARGADPVGAFLAALTRVSAGFEDPEAVEVRVESLGDQPVLSVPLSATHTQYRRLQAVSGRQSFDDQIYLAVADIMASPERRAFIQQRFRHVLVDEFQDLNGAQLALVDVLSRPGRELFVVGDDDQLIYGWRHADPRGILEFHRRMPPEPWSATYTLGTNYRCSRAVVESAARLVAHNTVREAKDVRPRDGAQAGAVRFVGAPAWAGRAAAVCAFLREQRDVLGCEWRELAVLCRYRSQQLAVALALDDAGVPRTPTLGYRLFATSAARLLRAYLDLVLAPGRVAGEQLRLLLNRPNRFLREATVERIAAAPAPWAHLLALAAAEPTAGPRPLSDLAERTGDLHATLASALPVAAGELLWAVVDAFGLEDMWAASDVPGEGRDEAGPLQVLDALLVLAESRDDVLRYLSDWDRLLAGEEAAAGMADDTLAREESGEDRVVIGTIHAAKGREYHAVAIPDYDCDVTRWAPAEIEEERRVVYVGVTRARDAALFTVDTSRPYRHPFLRELVERPRREELDALAAWLAETGGAGSEPGAAPPAARALPAHLGERYAQIALLFPELLPPEGDPG